MKLLKSFLLVTCFSVLTICSTVCKAQNSKPAVHLILDTDIGPDYDDVGAMAVMHALADKGEVIPLAVMASNKNELVAPVISLLNTWFGRPGLPVGAPKGMGAGMGAGQHWPEMLLKKYPHAVKSNDDVPDAVMLYRKILAAQPDHSVTIATIGFLTNLSGLLDSKADRYSALGGRQLVQKKVKLLVSMAGKFPAGREYNLFMDSTASTRVFMHWPGKIIFSGYEIGSAILTGPGLVSDKALNSPVKDVFAFCMPLSADDTNGRMSWDETAVLVAVKGAGPYFGLKRGHIMIRGGNNTWKDDAAGSQYYLTQVAPARQMTKVLESYMKHRPAKQALFLSSGL